MQALPTQPSPSDLIRKGLLAILKRKPTFPSDSSVSFASKCEYRAVRKGAGDQRFVLQQTKALKTSENHHIAETGYVCFCVVRTSPSGWWGCGRRDRLRGQRTLAVSGRQWQWRQVSRWSPRDITACTNIMSSKVFCSLCHYEFFKDFIGSNLRLP